MKKMFHPLRQEFLSFVTITAITFILIGQMTAILAVVVIALPSMFCLQGNTRRVNKMDNFNFNPTRQTSGFSKKNTFTSYDYNANLIREKARGLWPHILGSLGVPSNYLKNKHGPCPICQTGKDRFRFDDKGKGLYFCNKCGSGDGFKLLQLYHRWNFPYTLQCVAQVLGYQSYYVWPKHISLYIKKIVPSSVTTENEICKQKKKLNSVWQAAKSISQHDPVDCYLKARGIILEDFPSVLRFHPSLPYYDEE